MPATLTYPGVYVQEVPSGVRTVTGVSTSITAFIGTALQGPVNVPTRVQSFGEFERVFGGLALSSAMSFAVQQYFLNGGSDALIVRIIGSGTTKATASFGAPMALEAINPGAWGNTLEAIVDLNTSNPADTTLFNLTIRRVVNTVEVEKEVHFNLSTAASSPRYATLVLANESQLARVTTFTARPAAATQTFGGGADGSAPVDADYTGSQSTRTGIYALESADLFNMLCIPPKALGTTAATDIASATWAAAKTYCKQRRAMLVFDVPAEMDTLAELTHTSTGVDSLNMNDENVVTYWPRVYLPNSLRNNAKELFAPCGILAGVIARTDAARGVWKAPAGVDATLVGVQDFGIRLTDGEVGQINPLGVNALRSLPAAGNVAWGARTKKGADRLASEWKYLPVRRTALYIEESLYRGSQWAVFEPNDEPLWAQIRMNVGAFMQNLFRQGAFQGTSPREAYFVKCDKETTTQNDINLGVVNILVGFAPLKPAEFVVIKIQQIAGNIEV